MPNDYLPIGLLIKNHKCLIVGGGRVALRKIDILLDYDTSITVIAPKIDEKIEYYAGRNRLKLEKREYTLGEAAKYSLVIAASNDDAINKAVADDCRKAGIPVNVVDDPDLCDFIFPATIMRDCLTISVLSDGKAPFLSRQLRLILEDIFPERWKKIASLATEFRKSVHKRWKGDSQKKVECFQRFISADWKTMLKEKSDDDIKSELDKFLEN